MLRRPRTTHLYLEWDGRTVAWPERSVATVDDLDRNLWMLAEDVSMEIWGHFHRLSEMTRATGEEFISLQQCPADLVELLADAIPRHRGGDDLTDAMGDCVAMFGSEIVSVGEVDYELRFGRPPEDIHSKPIAVALRYVPRESLVWLGRTCTQVVHRGAEGLDSPPRVIRVQAERIIRFTPPRSRRNALSRIRATLPLIGQSESAWMNRSISPRSDEEFAVAKRSYDVAVARATADLGWNSRGLFQDHIADFHWVSRQLRWIRFCIEMRDHILGTLADAFIKAGRPFGHAPRLVINGLPTLADVDDAEQKLTAGGTRFDLLLKPFSHTV